MADETTLIRLSACLDGELPEPERAAVEAALARDPALCHVRGIFEKLSRSAAALPVPEVPQWRPIAARTTARDARFEARLRQAAGKLSPPPLDKDRFADAWRNIARRTVAAETQNRLAMQASASFDGESEGHVAPEQQQIWRTLDEAARALPVPAPTEIAWAECHGGITVQKGSTPARDHLVRAVAALRTPELSAEAASRAWAAIQARTGLSSLPASGGERQHTASAPPAPDVPPVSADKWKGVWSGIENRIARTAPADASVQAIQTVQTVQTHAAAHTSIHAREGFAPHRRRTWHPWRWASAAAIAAGLVIAVLVSRLNPAAPPEPVAMLLPEVHDQRYMVSVRYVDSQPEPVVCYFLKKGSGDGGDPGAPPDGSYGFSQMK